MEQLDRLATYFNERERKRLESKVKESTNGFPEMSEDEVRLSCLENNGYESPELNDKLYLHFRGFKRIENLDKYTGCKSIWLESNGFDRIQNLSAMVELRCLYLSKNLIARIEGLEALKNLTILDLSNNRLTRLENLGSCLRLQTLNVSHNALSSVDSVAHLAECPVLATVDLCNNHLPADDAIFGTLKQVPALVALSINGNGVTGLPSFRKKMISALSKLGYLDRPIDERERLCAEAFVAGGPEAEEQARIAWKDRQDEKRREEAATYKAWQAEQKKLREQARSEGRSLITEFTPEEQEQRRLEAQAAAEAEKKMLDLGVDRLASKFWKLEASGRGGDLLELAAEELQHEVSTREGETTNKEGDGEDDVPGRKVEEAAELPVMRVEDLPPAVQVQAASPEAEATPEHVLPPKAPEEAAKEAAAAAAVAAEEAEVQRAEKERRRAEMAAEQQRHQVVSDSMAMYLQQLQGRAQGATRSSTWEPALVSVPSAGQPDNRPLYWSEGMDMALAKQVQACAFDFDFVSAAMQEAAQQGKLGSPEVLRNPSVLTPDVCKQRWAELDASQWSTPAPGFSAKDTLFRVNLSDELIQISSGGQPTYEALKSMAAGLKPSYLKVPTAFPSVADFDELD